MQAETLKRGRTALGITQKTLADFLKLSTRQIIRYENGTTPVPGAVGILIDILTTQKIPKTLRGKNKPS